MKFSIIDHASRVAWLRHEILGRHRPVSALALAAHGRAVSFFGASWDGSGVSEGSDTSANALFGNLQVVMTNKHGMDPP